MTTRTTGRISHDIAISGEYLEKGEKTEPTPVYREFDGLGEARRNILSLIAERLRAEKASVEYRDVEQQGPAIVSKIKVNLRA